jgi:hypothetical protein
MNFNFQKSKKSQPLFIPLSTFSFGSFMVPMKFRQPAVTKAVANACDTRFFRRRVNSSRVHL